MVIQTNLKMPDMSIDWAPEFPGTPGSLSPLLPPIDGPPELTSILVALKFSQVPCLYWKRAA